MSAVTNRLERFRDPEYTGENRCVPCTVLNVVLGVVASTTLATVTAVAGFEQLALGLGTVLFVLSMTFIYFRGYLVPGTPTLTKRYFPAWLLSAFGKEPETGLVTGAGDDGGDGEMDIESVLVGADVLTEREDGSDLRLTDEFDRAFRDQVDEIRETPATPERLLDILDVGRGEVEVTEHGTAFSVRMGGDLVGTWESRPAFLADAAAAGLLSDRLDGWDRIAVRQRGQLLNGLRLFLTTCPGCGGELAFGTETVESCCTTHEVVAVSCEECDARVFEAKDLA